MKQQDGQVTSNDGRYEFEKRNKLIDDDYRHHAPFLPHPRIADR